MFKNVIEIGNDKVFVGHLGFALNIASNHINDRSKCYRT